MSGFVPITRGLVMAAFGFFIGLTLVVFIRTLTGQEEIFATDPIVVIGYVCALLGWLLGVGMWEHWAREWLGLPVKKPATQGWQRYFHFTLDHKVIGIQYLVTFLALFLLAGTFALIIRWELMTPQLDLLTYPQYAHTMSLHGISMVAVAVAAVIGSFGNYFVPLMIGAEDMAFPRLNALSFWLIPPVPVMLILTAFFGGFDSGWTAYPPLSGVNATGQIFFNLAVITFGLSSILGGLNFLVTVATLRAPGMTWGRLPIFVWSIVAAALISVGFTQFFAAALLMVLLDRLLGMSFFMPARGGQPLLYQHIFWFYSHPAVYVMILPGFGMALEILAHFSRKPLFAYRWAVGALLGIVALSGVVWAHHMFTSGMSDWLHAPFMGLTEAISIPTGLIFLAALGTIWMGKLWMQTPMLFALAFIFNFLIGGITGIFHADVATDVQIQDTYFVVAHFHYTIMGGEIFAWFGAIYYWFPKVTGRMYDERLGKLHFWCMFIAYQFTYIPMFWAGLQGMNRRIADYPAPLGAMNFYTSIAAFVLGASFLVFVYNFAWSWMRGAKAVANPWKARTLEWQTSSPPPVENFPAAPRVISGPYDYGVPNAATHAVFASDAVPVAGGGGGE
jgi:cytochrome c oxidase subunit 1